MLSSIVFYFIINMPFKILYNAFSFCFAKSFLTIFLIYH